MKILTLAAEKVRVDDTVEFPLCRADLGVVTELPTESNGGQLIALFADGPRVLDSSFINVHRP